MLMRFRRDESGIAMITVLLAMLVIVTISVATYQMSIGSLNHSAYDRERDEAIQAAQGAVGSYLAGLPSTTRLCQGVGNSVTLSTSPSITYKVSAVYWSKDGSTWDSSSNTSNTGTAGFCTSANSLKYSSVLTSASTSAKLVVVGSGAATSGAQTVTRKWQTLVDLSPVGASTISAFYGNSGVCINNNPVLLHSSTGNDALIYSGGDVDTFALCGTTNGNGNMVVEGSIYAQGDVNLKGCIEGDIWAKSITLTTTYAGACDTNNYGGTGSPATNQPPSPTCNGAANNFCYFADSSGGAYGDLTAFNGAITLSNTKAYGTCLASGAETWDSGSRCSSTRDATGFSPVACSGTIGSGATGCGTANALGLSAPTSIDFPTFTYAASDWSGSYAVVNENSGTAGSACPASIASDIISKVGSGVSGNYNIVFYVNPGCALTFANNSFTSQLKGNIVIVTTGSFNSGNNVFATSAGSCTNTSTKDAANNLMYPNGMCQFDVIVPSDAPTSACTAASHPTTWDITYGTTADLSAVDTIDYTPCWLNLGQSNTINGQAIAGVVNESNSFHMSFHTLSIPGFAPTGYNSAPEYFRECKAGTASSLCY